MESEVSGQVIRDDETSEPLIGIDETSGPVIGVDEAGRGPVIGPLVVAAVYADDQDRLKELGVRDSKQLSPERRQELAKGIRRLCRVETVIVTAKEIDDLRKRITLNEIEVNAFSQAIRQLLIDANGINDLTVFLDAADVKEERFGRDIEAKLLMKMGTVPKIVSRHKADDLFPIVSAASIIAKVTRDSEIEALKERYGELGSGYPSDPATKKYLAQLFKEGKEMPSYVRSSWETVKRMKDKASTKSLDDYL